MTTILKTTHVGWLRCWLSKWFSRRPFTYVSPQWNSEPKRIWFRWFSSACFGWSSWLTMQALGPRKHREGVWCLLSLSATVVWQLALQTFYCTSAIDATQRRFGFLYLSGGRLFRTTLSPIYIIFAVSEWQHHQNWVGVSHSKKLDNWKLVPLANVELLVRLHPKHSRNSKVSGFKRVNYKETIRCNPSELWTPDINNVQRQQINVPICKPCVAAHIWPRISAHRILLHCHSYKMFAHCWFDLVQCCCSRLFSETCILIAYHRRW